MAAFLHNDAKANFSTTCCQRWSITRKASKCLQSDVKCWFSYILYRCFPNLIYGPVVWCILLAGKFWLKFVEKTGRPKWLVFLAHWFRDADACYIQIGQLKSLTRDSLVQLRCYYCVVNTKANCWLRTALLNSIISIIITIKQLSLHNTISSADGLIFFYTTTPRAVQNNESWLI